MRAEILKISSETPEISLVKYAADQIRAGEVLGMPTDTFYGWRPIRSTCAPSTACMTSRPAHVINLCRC